ncbi:glycosyltransferase family 39 protein [Actinophytocola glycyrrhizae]|uniref:Glycosyltransferase family 39 protein n=1 Tax=Actinophytocola glycyrrhizae TaxID=2044873 RepID=A0ABV9S7W9_9PSEU
MIDAPVRTRSPFAAAPVTLVATILFGALMAVSTRYGYHRDELYFRLLGAQPATGYFDTPPLTPMVAKLSIALFGDNVVALRVVPALAVAGTVVLLALVCRELGGTHGAQVLAAVAVAVSSITLIAGHLLLTLTLDLPLWAAAILFMCKAIGVDDTGDDRWWLAFGATVGVATYNRQLIALLVLGIAVGILIAGPRSVLASKWLWFGAMLALVLALPNLLYQSTHDWPQAQMAEALDLDDGDENRIMFGPLQFGLLGFGSVLAIAGLVSLWRRRTFRFFVLAYPVACGVTVYSGGRADYVAGFLLALCAAGSVPVAGWMTTVTRRTVVVLGLVATAVVSVPLGLPVLPVSAFDDLPIGELNETAPESVGWERFAEQIGDVASTIPTADRVHAVVLAENYGQAGAVDRWSEQFDLPPVYSGHNELWWRAMPDEHITAVIMATDSPRAQRLFRTCERHATVDDGVGSWNEEQGKPILLCSGPVRTWAELWPELRHYS